MVLCVLFEYFPAIQFLLFSYYTGRSSIKCMGNYIHFNFKSSLQLKPGRYES